MILLPINASDEQLLELVRSWATLLANEDYRAAFELTDHDPYYRWTPELIQTVVQNYGSVEPLVDRAMFKVSPLDSAVGGPTPRQEVQRFENPRRLGGERLPVLGNIWFDLPLNGEWSDLTATFEIQESEDGVSLVLNDIHVF